MIKDQDRRPVKDRRLISKKIGLDGSRCESLKFVQLNTDISNMERSTKNYMVVDIIKILTSEQEYLIGRLSDHSVFFFLRNAANKLADAADTGGGVFRFFVELAFVGDGVDLEFCSFKF